ncbi:MAG: undecaprenyl-diphosphate phosphatase [Firmicutes bacterium]|nr:undecaprenyl-diphosphate phosphatase [Bacillota bacterium]
MDYIKYIILGIVQGISEPLPVSSSGHIYLFKNLFNTEMFNTFNFEIISNFGSFLAILFIFRKDIIELIKNFFTFIFSKEKRNSNKNGFMYVIKMIISTIPVGITGILFNDYLESHYNSLKMLGFSFLFTALMLYIVRNIKGEKDSNGITIKDAIIIGLFQAITIIPGISRSGTVLVACLICKLKREDALKYTFMLYFPVSLGTMLLKAPELISTPTSLLLPYLCGMVAALIITYFSYKWLSNLVKKGKLWKFSIYCLCLAFFIFIWFR